jgi:hypothetical protein
MPTTAGDLARLGAGQGAVTQSGRGPVWQSRWVKTAFAIVGLVLNVVGTLLAGWALLVNYEEHAGRPFWPGGKAISEWFRVNIRRKPTRRSRVHAEAHAAWNVEIHWLRHRFSRCRCADG